MLSTMQTKALLGSLLVLATFVTVCKAHCYLQPLVQGEGDSLPVCRDLDGTTHPINSTWMSWNCTKCVCYQNKLECCSILHIPLQYDKSKCHTVFHTNDCSVTVVQTWDQPKPCTFYVRILDVLKAAERVLLPSQKPPSSC
ncbi:PREDICTED: beta-microseminoprotein-like [Chinchilla lanigera]|uniref:beta-microseminoprotein-like n=1 Tax=Chinchilla lanigera TaxID=34839 RepID=UPI00038EACA9|nr:PREDICTED: beta-microseminoprotein-like [Chinchilla lanigera]